MNQVEVKRRQIEAFAYIIGLAGCIIFGKILGNGGITYLVVSLECISLLWTVVSGALPESLGRIIKGRNARGQYRNAACIRRRAMVVQIIVGAVFGFLCLALAEPLAKNFLKIPYSSDYHGVSTCLGSSGSVGCVQGIFFRTGFGTSGGGIGSASSGFISGLWTVVYRSFG